MPPGLHRPSACADRRRSRCRARGRAARSPISSLARTTRADRSRASTSRSTCRHVAIVGPAGSGKRGADAAARRPDASRAGRSSRSAAEVCATLPEAVHRPPHRLRRPRPLHVRRQPRATTCSSACGTGRCAAASMPPETRSARRASRSRPSAPATRPSTPTPTGSTRGGRAARDPEERLRRASCDVLRVVDLEDDVYNLGLRGSIDPPSRGDLPSASARGARTPCTRACWPTSAWRRLVEPFDPDRYNTNATLAENLLFGTPGRRAASTSSGWPTTPTCARCSTRPG